MDRIYPDHDFTDEGLRYLYNFIVNCYLFTGDLNDTAINVYLGTLQQDDRTVFSSYGGLNALKRLGNVAADIPDFSRIFNRLKTHQVMRDLREKHINVLPYYDKFKDRAPEVVLKAYDNTINKIALRAQGVNTPKSIASGIKEYLAELEENPDVGLELPFDMITSYLRGIRKHTINCIAAHTNKGKTRIITRILTHTSILNDTKAMLISTEQTDKEMKLQFITSVHNNITSPHDVIEESAIAKQELTDAQRASLDEAADYFIEHNNIDFICTNLYDLPSLKNLIKQAKLKGCSLVVIDVLKPCRSTQTKDMQEWQQYSYTVEQLRDMCVEMDMAIIFTAQLTPQSLESGVLEFSSIANGTHISFILDSLLMFRDITHEEKLKWGCQIKMKNNPLNGKLQPFDTDKNYMLCKIVKNRGGAAGNELVFEVDKGKISYKELGYLNKSAVKG